MTFAAHPGDRGTASAGGPRETPRAPRRAGPLRRLDRGDEFSDLQVVVTACNRRGALARCLHSLRPLAALGADIVYADAHSADGSPAHVRSRFGFCRVVDLDVQPSRPFVLLVSVDVECDRWSALRLLGAGRRLAPGVALAPRLIGPSGTRLELPVGELACLYRAEDLPPARAPQVRRVDHVTMVVPRPDEALDHPRPARA